MKNRVKKAIAFLLTMLLALNILPAASPADTGEIGPLGLSLTRGTWIELRVGRKDTMTYQEILGNYYTDTLDIKAYNIDQSYQTVPGANVVAEWSTKKVYNLNTIPFETPLKWSIYDGADGTWPYEAVVYRDAYAVVDQTGRLSYWDAMSQAGAAYGSQRYDYMVPIDSDACSGLVEWDNENKQFNILSTSLPAKGLAFRIVLGGGTTPPYRLVLLGSDNPEFANDGVLAYSLNESTGTATVTGFWANCPYDETREDVTIPAEITWPKNGGRTYRVTAVDDSAFLRNAYLTKLTIASPVMSIGAHAFEQAPLTEVHVTGTGENSRLSIGEQAFFACGELETFESAPGIAVIGPRAFAYDGALQTLTGGSSQATVIEYTNAFQNTSGELTFGGGISEIAAYTFYGTRVTKITTTEITGNLWNANTNTIDLVLNRDAKIETLDKAKLNALLKNAAEFKTTTLNLNGGVDTITADVFDGISLDGLGFLTINIGDNGGTTTVEEGAVPKSNKLAIHFDMYRADVAGSAQMIPLEADGEVTYKDSASVSSLFHDDVFWYEKTNSSYTVIGLYDTDLTEITFTDSNQGTVYNAAGEETELTLSVSGVKAEAFAADGRIESVTISNGSFSVGKDAFRGMTALKTVTVDDPIVLPTGAFADCTALEEATLGSTDNQTGRQTIPADAFANCPALATFTCRINTVTVRNSAFAGCTGLKVIAFTGKGAQTIPAGTFGDAAGLEILRLDNSCSVAEGAFNAENGTTILQNTNEQVNASLAGKAGLFENYVFTGGSPWTISDDAFQGDTAARVYILSPGANIPKNLVRAVKNAGGNLTDVYLDCSREEVSFADELDEANGQVRIHYRENTIPAGVWIDGVNGDDSGDGSEEAPFKTFAKVKQALDERAGSTSTGVQDTTMTGTDASVVESACARLGLDVATGTFTDLVEDARMATVLNTVTVTGSETWDGGDGGEILLIRDTAFTGALVDVKGTLTLENVILDGNRKKVTAKSAMVTAESGSELTLGEGAVLRGNAYPEPSRIKDRSYVNGGAICAENATVNIRDGSSVENNLALTGGGIMMRGGTLNMTGGTIRGNTAQASSAKQTNGMGGGVTLCCGATMNLSGGSITGNKADGIGYSAIGINGSTGGGIQVGDASAADDKETRLNMTGGSVSNNTAYAQAGGIYVQSSSVAEISAGQITGNVSGRGEFGGGGIYVNGGREGRKNGLLKLNNVLITDNDSPYGGGIACCETVNLSLFMGRGAAIYGNRDSSRGRHSDLFLFNRGTMGAGGTKAKLASEMMNGAPYNWTYVILSDYRPKDSSIRNGQKVPESVLAYIDAGSLGHMVLRSNPTNTRVNAKVVITGNRAKTKGGGIASNGNVVIGDPPPVSDVVITPDVSKQVFGRDTKAGETFRFSVYLETSSRKSANGHMVYSYQDTLVGTGTWTGGTEGHAAKAELPSYTVKNVGEGNLGDTYTLLIVEDTRSTSRMDADDRTYYAQTYTIGQGVDASGKACYKAYLTKTEQGSYTRGANGEPVFEYGTVKREGYVPFDMRIRKEADGALFTNYLLDRSASARKEWRDKENQVTSAPEGASVTFELLADGEPAVDLNGKAVAPVTLDGIPDTNGEKEAWRAVWENLPIYRNKEHRGRIVYTVHETACVPAGYFSDEAVQEIPANGTAVIVNRDNTIQKTVRKVWIDNGNAEGTRPAAITVRLKANGKVIGTVTLNSENEWTATISKLPASDENGKITYTWSEQTVIGYILVAQEEKDDVTTLTNSQWKRPDEPEKGRKPKLPGPPLYSIDDYDTPLGVEVIINHVGDCFD